MALPKSERPRDTLDMLSLQVVAVGLIHGKAITQRLRQVSRHALQVPVSSALHRLEDHGLVDAEGQQSETAPAAKFCVLTPKGRAQLKNETANRVRLSEAIGLILRTAKGGAR